MAVNFYLANKGENGWVENKIFTDDKFEQFVEEVKMVLGTKLGQVMGAEDMDGDLEEFIYRSYIEPSEVSKKLRNQLANHTTLADDFNYDISAEFANGTRRHVCLILMDVYDKNTNKKLDRLKIVYS